MKPSSLTLLLLLLLLLLRLSHQSSPPSHVSIEEACKEAASSRTEVDYDFCVRSLTSDPTSRFVDTVGLAIVAARLIIASANTTVSRIEKLLTNETDPARRGCLLDCGELYSNSPDGVNSAVSEISAGNYETADTDLKAAFWVATNCEKGFSDGGVESPLSAENRDFLALSLIARSIIAPLA